GRDHDAAVDLEALSANTADRDLATENEPGGEVPQRDDHLWIDQLDLALEVRRARLDLVRKRVPVSGRSALEDVADVHVLAAQADLAEHRGQKLAGGSHERLALLVLVIPGSLSDEHDVGLRTPDTEHDLGAAVGQPALRAGRRDPAELLERHRHGSRPSRMSRTAGKFGTPVARRTARRMASAATSDAIASTSAC